MRSRVTCYAPLFCESLSAASKNATIILLLLINHVEIDDEMNKNCLPLSHSSVSTQTVSFGMTTTTTSPPTTTETATITNDGEVISPIGAKEKTQKDYYQNAGHYDNVWGSDNLHFGFYPHLDVVFHERDEEEEEKKKEVRLNQDEASSLLTQRIIDMVGIKKGMRVVDLGAGKGRACLEIARATRASCVGLDITPAYVERGNEIAAKHPDLDLRFVEGSFTNLPQELMDIKGDCPFDVVFVQVAFCHVHSQMAQILEQIKRLMGPESVLIVNDYLGGDRPNVSPATKEHVYKRLHFEKLLGPRQWREAFDEAGFSLVKYETLDAHMKQGYLDMAATAQQLNFNSTDGTPLYLNYLQTAEAIDRHEIGMNLALYRLK